MLEEDDELLLEELPETWLELLPFLSEIPVDAILPDASLY